MDLLVRSLFLLSSIQGFFLGIALLIRNRRKIDFNWFFSALLFSISLMLLTRYLYSWEIFFQYPKAWYLIEILRYAVCPLWYFFISSLHGKIQFGKKEWIALVPAFLELAVLIFNFTKNKEDFLALTQSTLFVYLMHSFVYSAIFVNGWFLYLTQKRFFDNRGHLPKGITVGQKLLMLICMVWFLAYLIAQVSDNSLIVIFTVYNFSFLCLGLAINGIAFVYFLKPESFNFLSKPIQLDQLQTLEKLARSIESLMKEEELFLKPDCNLQEISNRIGSNTKTTSQAINSILNTSLPDLINSHRIDHFLSIVRNDELKNLKLWAIAQESGFKNKMSFYNAFKKQLGTTPAKYLENIH
ncbi:MAG: helix-turn-helix domain-containing protein [Bacteroidota bacterium]